MIWFKHDTDASTDAKMRKLIIRYGAEGYAVYFHCLELIAGDVNENNITFELEHDAEIIADNLKILSTPDCSSIDKVGLIMNYIIELDLFSESKGRIFCFKMLKRLDTSMTSSGKFRALITKAKQSHDGVMIGHDVVMQDKIRIDKNRKDKIIYQCKHFEVTEEEHIEYKEKFRLYDIDYDLEYRNMTDWLTDKNKTYKNYNRFINNWLNRCVKDKTPKKERPELEDFFVD